MYKNFDALKMSISFLNKENHQEFEIKRQISSPDMTKGAFGPFLYSFPTLLIQ